MKKAILISLFAGFVFASCSNGDAPGTPVKPIKKTKDQIFTRDTIRAVVDSAHILVTK